MPRMSPLAVRQPWTPYPVCLMHYLQAYRFVFKSPKWMLNLLLTSISSLIPVVGPIVLIGYFFDIIDVLIRRRALERLGDENHSSESFGERVMDALPAEEDYRTASYPDFDFNLFADYLTRGLWPFLIRFAVNLIVAMLASFVLIVGMILVGMTLSASNSVYGFILMYGSFWIIYAFLIWAMGILTTPLYLRAGLSGDFASAFSMAFYRDFMKRVGKEVVAVELFMAATGAVLTVMGILMCYFGLFPAFALISYAHHHLEYQLYELYLERGGEPIERKDKQRERYAEADAPLSRNIQTQPRERSTDVMRPEQEW